MLAGFLGFIFKPLGLHEQVHETNVYAFDDLIIGKIFKADAGIIEGK